MTRSALRGRNIFPRRLLRLLFAGKGLFLPRFGPDSASIRPRAAIRPVPAGRCFHRVGCCVSVPGAVVAAPGIVVSASGVVVAVSGVVVTASGVLVAASGDVFTASGLVAVSGIVVAGRVLFSPRRAMFSPRRPMAPRVCLRSKKHRSIKNESGSHRPPDSSLVYLLRITSPEPSG